MIEIAERPEGHAVAEVGAPASQYRVEPEEQGGERAMLLPAGQRSTFSITDASAFLDGYV
jgi:hypothetical protein